ncbi:MAG TPA: general secretion pathway protein GspB [Ramlibacter sp.]|jgi:general secretion pathway protein B|uniref:general secretion pathway protein GspB n=1 Tax=Ramlibacter sp. TaxID=1917967 RepID=UPI002D49C0E5|nr:general secretion pathway protein GspB [Ramlibacter sp.]HZY19328.1 general secretion pathway protein GspB [Ramlibacter sp.]
MSYILDALRKADAQRERSRAPGLHAHTAPAEADDARRDLLRSPLVWGLVAAGLASLVAVGWTLRGSAPPAAPAPVPQAAPASIPGAGAPSGAGTVPQAAAPVPAPAIEPPPPAPVARAEPREPATGTLPGPQARRSTPVAAATGQGGASASGQRQASPAAPGATTGSTASAAAATGVGQPGAAAPAGAPALAITGGVYSQAAAQRMLIVNGQVVGEGAEAAPGVRIEQIRPQQAVLSWQGQRWTVRY